MPAKKAATQAEALGITQEAFESAGAALRDSVDGGLPGEPAGDEVAPAPAAEAMTEKEQDVETPPQPAEPQPTNPAYVGWAAVKAAEQRLLQTRTQFERQVAEFRREKEALSKVTKEQTDIIAALRQDPRNLEKYGINLQDFIQSIIAVGNGQPAPTARAEENPLAKEVAELRQQVKSFIEGNAASREEAAFRSIVEAGLRKPEFELLRANPEAIDQVIKFAGAYYHKTGVPILQALTIDQILVRMQSVWEERVKSLGSSAAVRKVFGVADAPTPEPASDTRSEPPRRTKPRTVTPAMVSSPAKGSGEPVNKRPLTDEEQIREAMKLVPPGVWDDMG